MGISISNTQGYSWIAYNGTIVEDITITSTSSVNLSSIVVRLGSGYGSARTSNGNWVYGDGGNITVYLVDKSTGSTLSTSTITKAVDPSGYYDSYDGSTVFNMVSGDSAYNVTFNLPSGTSVGTSGKSYRITAVAGNNKIAVARAFSASSVTVNPIMATAPSTPVAIRVRVEGSPNDRSKDISYRSSNSSDPHYYNNPLYGKKLMVTAAGGSYKNSSGQTKTTTHFRFQFRDSNLGGSNINNWSSWGWWVNGVFKAGAYSGTLTNSAGSTISSSTSYLYTTINGSNIKFKPYIQFRVYGYENNMYSSNYQYSDWIQVKLNPPQVLNYDSNSQKLIKYTGDWMATNVGNILNLVSTVNNNPSGTQVAYYCRSKSKGTGTNYNIDGQYDGTEYSASGWGSWSNFSTRSNNSNDSYKSANLDTTNMRALQVKSKCVTYQGTYKYLDSDYNEIVNYISDNIKSTTDRNHLVVRWSPRYMQVNNNEFFRVEVLNNDDSVNQMSQLLETGKLRISWDEYPDTSHQWSIKTTNYSKASTIKYPTYQSGIFNYYKLILYRRGSSDKPLKTIKEGNITWNKSDASKAHSSAMSNLIIQGKSIVDYISNLSDYNPTDTYYIQLRCYYKGGTTWKPVVAPTSELPPTGYTSETAFKGNYRYNSFNSQEFNVTKTVPSSLLYPIRNVSNITYNKTPQLILVVDTNSSQGVTSNGISLRVDSYDNNDTLVDTIKAYLKYSTTTAGSGAAQRTVYYIKIESSGSGDSSYYQVKRATYLNNQSQVQLVVELDEYAADRKIRITHLHNDIDNIYVDPVNNVSSETVCYFEYKNILSALYDNKVRPYPTQPDDEELFDTELNDNRTNALVAKCAKDIIDTYVNFYGSSISDDYEDFNKDSIITQSTLYDIFESIKSIYNSRSTETAVSLGNLNRYISRPDVSYYNGSRGIELNARNIEAEVLSNTNEVQIILNAEGGIISGTYVDTINAGSHASGSSVISNTNIILTRSDVLLYVNNNSNTAAHIIIFNRLGDIIADKWIDPPKYISVPSASPYGDIPAYQPYLYYTKVNDEYVQLTSSTRPDDWDDHYSDYYQKYETIFLSGTNETSNDPQVYINYMYSVPNVSKYKVYSSPQEYTEYYINNTSNDINYGNGNILNVIIDSLKYLI